MKYPKLGSTPKELYPDTDALEDSDMFDGNLLRSEEQETDN